MPNRTRVIGSGHVLIIVVPLVIIASWLTANYTSQRTEDSIRAALDRQHADSVKACVRGNALRVQLNSSIAELRASPLPLADCRKAYRTP